MSIIQNCPIIPIITGPTAVGKTQTSIELAKKMNGEIVSIDSRQLYKYLDIGTAKPTLREQTGIPHHLIDIFEPNVLISAGKYRDLATKTVHDIVSRGKLPIFVGGSGMYIKAIIHGIFKQSKSDPEIRNRLLHEIKEKGNALLYNRLVDVDPDSATKIHLNDSKRITRALEIFEITGKPASQLYKNQVPDPAFPTKIFVFHMKRDELYKRINQRVDQMLNEGLIDETQNMIDQGHRDALDTIKTIGYQEVIQYLDNTVSLEEMTENLKQNTRRYAKRQLTWFRNQLDAEWIEMNYNYSPEKVAKNIEKSLSI